MKVHKAEKNKRRAEEAIRLAAYRMGLPAWLNIVVGWDYNHSEERVACETNADWEYRQVSFKWNLPLVASLTDDDLNETAVHELIHALIAPLWDCLTDKQQAKKHTGKLNELATENVARVITHLMRENDERTVSVTSS